jgi:hypothetical protein
VSRFQSGIVTIASTAIAILGVVASGLVPNGEPVTIDNRGLLGPFDVAEPDPASQRVWLRFLVLGLGVALALCVRAIDRGRRSRSLAWAAGVVIATACVVALAYPTGPPYPPPEACLPQGRLGPTATQCRVFYSDHQPGPTYLLLRGAILASGICMGLGLAAAARRTRQRSTAIT